MAIRRHHYYFTYFATIASLTTAALTRADCFEYLHSFDAEVAARAIDLPSIETVEEAVYAYESVLRNAIMRGEITDFELKRMRRQGRPFEAQSRSLVAGQVAEIDFELAAVRVKIDQGKLFEPRHQLELETELDWALGRILRAPHAVDARIDRALREFVDRYRRILATAIADGVLQPRQLSLLLRHDYLFTAPHSPNLRHGRARTRFVTDLQQLEAEIDRWAASHASSRLHDEIHDELRAALRRLIRSPID